MLNSFLFWVLWICSTGIVTLWRIKKKDHIIHGLILIIFMIYIGMVVTITLFPLPIQKEEIESLRETNFVKNVYIPFSDITFMIKYSGLTSIMRNIGGNIVLLMPFGVILPFVIRKHIQSSKMFFIGAITSLGIETTQAIISLMIGARYKTTSVDDIILNTIGTMIGYLFYYAMMKATRKFTVITELLSYHVYAD